MRCASCLPFLVVARHSLAVAPLGFCSGQLLCSSLGGGSMCFPFGCWPPFSSPRALLFSFLLSLLGSLAAVLAMHVMIVGAFTHTVLGHSVQHHDWSTQGFFLCCPRIVRIQLMITRMHACAQGSSLRFLLRPFLPQVISRSCRLFSFPAVQCFPAVQSSALFRVGCDNRLRNEK